VVWCWWGQKEGKNIRRFDGGLTVAVM